MNVRVRIGTSLVATAALAACSPVEDPSLYPAFDAASAQPIAKITPTVFSEQRNLYWGDLHIHTSYSTDAYTNGVRTLPDDAYTFARGGEIPHPAGYGISLSRPLDFAAVTDHSEFLGVLRATRPDMLLNRKGLRERLLSEGPLELTLNVAREMLGFDLENAEAPGADKISRQAWQEIVDSAERNYYPGRFTSFVAYEWSSMPDERNLHRNVIYRSAKVPDLPFSSIDSEDPRDLWTALEQQRDQGMDVFAVPHNGNVSDGLMYDSVAFDGSAFNADYARRRNTNEPISEIFQVKGSSETHPALSPRDEFAGFEIYDTQLAQSQEDSRPEGSYIRDALRLGMEVNHREGFNPYRFGVIGSSDGHNASAPVEEDNYHGKLAMFDGSAGLRMGLSTLYPNDMPGGLRWSAAGLAAVWARENTREALFDAMRRRETYATSGPRIAVRFFAAMAFPDDLFQRADWVELADRLGVPMGGEVVGSAETGPEFAIWAIRDPDGANLDRLQVIKGWVDETGQSRERIFNVAWSGNRTPDAKDELPAIGNTVDAASASYANSIGSGQLATLWRDPEFEPRQQAFYYARVIEIPTPRWTTYDALTLGIQPPEPVSLQERAVTSAIWYRPANATN